MKRDTLDKWATKLGQAWVELDADAALSLVSKNDIVWYESPFDSALTNWNSIHEVWTADLKGQRDVQFSHEILVCDDSDGIVRWSAQFVRIADEKTVNLDGVFHIRLNDDNLCTYFMMWSVEKG